MTEYAELEIVLTSTESDSFQVELRFDDPNSEALIAPGRGSVTIDMERLTALQLEPKAYGEALTASLFEDAEVSKLFAQVKAAVGSSELQLRLRLTIGESAPQLHSIRWELLTDPDTHRPLATSERILFSRFVTSQDWRSIRLRRKTELKALIAVSAPSNVEKYQLAKVDRDGEIERARESLKGIQVTVAGDPLTLNELLEQLRQDVDIVYLVCHGKITRKQQPVLFLQDEKGEIDPTSGADLAARLSELSNPPRLMVLASCESAGSESDADSHAQAAMAPRLAEAGVPAIVAMQGQISMETVKKAMPVFFEELLKDGRIDRAMAVARGTVREQPDSWMPAVFLRLKQGRIWYEPGFGTGQEDFKKWAAIIDAIKHRRVTFFLGPGLAEHIYGSRRDTASRVAGECAFPLAPYQREQLAPVCQYLGVEQDTAFVRSKIKEEYSREIRRLHPDAVKGLPEDAPLGKLIKVVSDHLWKEGKEGKCDEPHWTLAQLPCALYITVNQDDLLTLALKAVGKDPNSCVFRWREGKGGETKRPDVRNPVVFHALGHFRDEETLVLTEDDYFDYMIQVARNPKLIPSFVEAASVNKSMVFLGFNLTDWNFRVLFRRIMNQGGRSKLKNFAHVSGQLDPDESRTLNTVRAKEYLKDYFSKEASMNIYWGSAQDFLRELKEQLEDVDLSSEEDENGEDDEFDY